MSMKYIAIGAVVALMMLGGCMGLIAGDGLELASNPGTVADSAVQSTGYELGSQENMTMNRTVSYEGQERDISLTNWMTTYTKSANFAPGQEQEFSRFLVFTTPEVNVFGQSLNPVGQMGSKQFIEFAGERYTNVDDIEAVNETTVETLGTDANVTEYEGTIQTGGQDINATFHLTQVTHEGDLVFGIGVYPEQIDEKENIHTLIENIEHSGDSDES